MNRTLPLDEKIAELTRALADADIPHAFGGALALAYYAEPRATVDIDLNVFLCPDEIAPVLDVLVALDVSMDQRRLRREAPQDGQSRVMWGDTPLDLFFSYDDFHVAAAERVRMVPFGRDRIPILAPEDLAVCKVVFDRRKDWLDIEQILFTTAGELDLDNIRGWVTRMVGPDDPRVARLESAIADILGQ